VFKWFKSKFTSSKSLKNKTGGLSMAEKREIEINSRADTMDLMNPDIRPWPVTPPPTPNG